MLEQPYRFLLSFDLVIPQQSIHIKYTSITGYLLINSINGPACPDRDFKSKVQNHIPHNFKLRLMNKDIDNSRQPGRPNVWMNIHYSGHDYRTLFITPNSLIKSSQHNHSYQIMKAQHSLSPVISITIKQLHYIILCPFLFFSV